jgi:adhesin transport system membrane fusion protein
MLNITEKSISPYIDTAQYGSYRYLESKSNTRAVWKVLIVISIIGLLCMFLPWTQNIRSKGYVTTLNPYDKPQYIQALIGGQIEEWFVTEGDIVSIGDTIVRLSEAKADYLDPELLSNTKEQQLAKLRSAEAYKTKRGFLQEQIRAIKEYQGSKLEQLTIKQEQVGLEVATSELDLEAADTYAENATNQLKRMETMYNSGIKSLTDLESKRLSNREALAKRNSITNKLNKFQTEKQSLLQEIEIINTEYEQKLAKLESEINSADSYRYSLMGESNKLQSKYNEIEQRQGSFIITSPINGRITKVLINGIGEYVKAQESLVTIVPTNFKKAVELYIIPNDMPLIKEGKKVRVQFDGWPAIVFSGWPDNSFGTFGGRVFAVDNDISENGKYRILVIEDDAEKPWPNLIRIGSGAQGLLLLNDVSIYYEIWRQLNGFPPDFYVSEKTVLIKNKAPIKKFK